MNVVTPKLLPSEYTAANDLKTQVKKAQDTARVYPQQAAAINRYLAAVGGASLESTQAIVEDGDELAVTGGTVTLTVTDGVVTAEYTAA